MAFAQANSLAAAIGKLAGDGLTLQMIDNRGVKVWPEGRAETLCTDNFRCRFLAEGVTRQADCSPCSIASPKPASISP